MTQEIIDQKAKEIVSQFAFARTDDHESFVAKQCALIHVSGIIDKLSEIHVMSSAVMGSEHSLSMEVLKMWEDEKAIKAAIEKM